MRHDTVFEFFLRAFCLSVVNILIELRNAGGVGATISGMYAKGFARLERPACTMHAGRFFNWKESIVAAN